ncbi:MAG: lipoate--protein ligase family protein [Candidatus Zipacnadales bacterium]
MKSNAEQPLTTFVPPSKREWRLVISEPAAGAHNMAVDEALFRARAEGLVPPTLRLYRWQPPTVSLGRFQELDDRIDMEAIRRRGYGLVRRPTGGRAILHADELTYSVAVREDDIPGGGSLMSSYRTLSRGIEQGLAYLGIQTGFGQERDSGQGAALPTICFAKAARCDLVVGGRKIVGSAQTRSRGAILQHGSIPLTIDVDELLSVMPGPRDRPLEERRQKLQQAAIGVAQLLGRPVTVEELSEAICWGFSVALGVTLTPGSLLPQEQEWIEHLITTKYAMEAWTVRPLPRPC